MYRSAFCMDGVHPVILVAALEQGLWVTSSGMACAPLTCMSSFALPPEEGGMGSPLIDARSG